MSESKRPIVHCPMCGSPCRIEGGVTNYYKPLADALLSAAKALGESPSKLNLTSRRWWKLYAELRKAIADYEKGE